jgi:hypothetical protein
MPWLEEEIAELDSGDLNDKEFFIEVVQLLFSYQGVDAVTSNALAQLPADVAQLCADARANNEGARVPWDMYAWCLPEDVSFDRSAILEDIQKYILEPLDGAQSLFDDYVYTTRLTTTMSPSEMSLDPLFSFNPDLPPVDNVTTAVIEPVCEEGDPVGVRIKLPNGGSKVVYGEMDFGFLPADARISEEAAGTIQVMSESGPPELISTDEVAEKQLVIEGRGPSEGRSEVEADASASVEEPTGTFGTAVASRVDEPIPNTAGTGASGTSSTRSSSDGCTAAPFAGGQGSAAWLLGLCLLVLVIRRSARHEA